MYSMNFYSTFILNNIIHFEGKYNHPIRLLSCHLLILIIYIYINYKFICIFKRNNNILIIYITTI